MPDTLTRLDLYALGRDYVLSRATRIDPAQVDVEGSDVNIIVGVSSVMAYQVQQQLLGRTAALTLDGSDDEDLDRYAYDRYSEVRKGASPALGTVVISRANFAAGAGDIPIGTKLQTSTGFEYVTITTATLGATDLVTRADVRASQAGKATQAAKNQINRFSNVSTLFDRTLTATNLESCAGGEDAETDEVFRARIRTFWKNARRGILSAIEQGATSVPGVVSAQAIEVLTTGSQPARLVELFISDSSGVASEALAAVVRMALNEYRAAGIQVLISTSLPLLVGVALRLAFRANVDTATITDNVRGAVVAFTNSLSVNGTLYVSELYSVLQRYVEDGLVVSKGTLVSPTGDLIPDVGQTIRTTPALVTITF